MLVVFESRTLEWFAARVDTIELRCNAHRDMHTTVARHLLDRERRGEKILFESENARQQCVDSDILWELSLRHIDGQQVHVASAKFENCVLLLQKVDRLYISQAAAA